MRRSSNTLCVVSTAMLLGLCGCPQAATILQLVTATCNLTLMEQAETLVQADYPHAMLIEANGVSTSGSASVGEDIDRWQFVFDSDSADPGAGTVTIEYAGGDFQGAEFVASGWIGTVYERLPRVLSLCDAVDRMRAAGYTGPFTSVTLRKPLIFPVPDEALYALALSGQNVLVGAETGTVSVE